MFYARYPSDSVTQKIILDNGIGVIVPQSSLVYLYPDLDADNPQWDDLDQRLATIPDNQPVHCHPIISRSMQGFIRRDIEDIKRFVYPVLEKYGNRVERWTLCNELLQSPAAVQMKVISLYEDVARDFPSLKLWVGEYGLRTAHSVNGLAPPLLELKAAADIEGLVFVDYMDIAVRNSNRVSWLRGLLTWAELFQGWLKSNNLSPQTVDDFIQAIELLKPEYIGLKVEKSFKQLSTLDIKLALETSVLTGANPTEHDTAKEVLGYQVLVDLCQRYSVDFWHWNICDRAVGIPWDKDRNGTDCPGWWDRDGQLKPWAEKFFKQ